MGQTLPKSALLRRPRQYRRVYAVGRRCYGPGVTLIFAANGRGENRLGISVSGIKLAVRRNRIKRLIREYYRLHRDFPSRLAGETGGVDVIVATRKSFAATSLGEVTALLEPMVASGPGRRS